MSGWEMVEEAEDWACFWRGFRRGYLIGAGIALPPALVYLIGHFAGVWP